MDVSPRLDLPYIMASQAQKHVTHNEAVRMLDCLVQPVVQSRALSSPPASPTEGDGYIVATGASDAWSGREGQVACFQDGAWQFFTPAAGWRVHDTGAGESVVFTGTAWEPFRGGAGLPWLGVNTDAGEANRLSVAAAKTLLTHEGDDHRLTINKAASADTASVVFQTGFSGRAEFGLAGDDDWHVKISADGAAWSEALIADRSTGAVKFPSGLVHAPTGQPMHGLVFTPGGDGAISLWRLDDAHAQNPRTATIAAVSGDTITLSTPDAGLFFHAFMENVSLVRIWNTSKAAPGEPAWVKAVSGADQLQVLDASALAGWASGETVQIGDPTSVTASRCIAVDISPMLENLFGVSFRQAGIMLKAYMAGETGDVIGVTPTGVSGSFATAVAYGAGDGAAIIPCTEPSPVSDSNLVFLRETISATATIEKLDSIALFV